MTDKDFYKLSEFTLARNCFIPLTQDILDYFSDLVGKDLIESQYCLIPTNENALNLCENASDGQILNFQEIEARDIHFHRCYMSLLKYIWEYLPDNFHKAIPSDKFYLFLKHLTGKYNVVYRFKDELKKQEIAAYLKEHKKEFRITYKVIEKISETLGKSELIDYISISFGRMNQSQFEQYVKEQMPFLYSSVIGAFYDGEEYQNIIDTIEKYYQKFFDKLFQK